MTDVATALRSAVGRPAPTPRRRGISFIIRRLEVGGAQRQMVTLANALTDRGMATSVFTLYPGGALVPELRSEWLDDPTSRGGRLLRLVRVALKVVRRTRIERPLAVYSFLVGQNVLGAMLRPLLPRATALVWGVRVSEMLSDNLTVVGRLSYVAERALSRIPDAIICNSEAGARTLTARRFPADRVHVIPNGISVDRFSPSADERARLRAAWGLAEGDFAIGIVGRLDPVKDHELFLETARELAVDREVCFVCVGAGEEAFVEGLKAHAAGLGLAERVLWTGPMTNMCAVYNALDLVCLTSRHEAMPNVLLEAMACGTPCVSVDVGDAASMLASDGVVVHSREPRELANACREMRRRLASDELLSMRLRSRILDEFSETLMTERTLALIEQLARRRERSAITRRSS